jgi:hypothetical protein
MAVPDSLPQRVFLLAYNPARGRLAIDSNLGSMLRAAALADLYLTGHLTDERGRAAIEVRHPCHDSVLSALLDEIAGSRPRTWQSWVGRGCRAARSAVRQQLGDGGWVRLEPRKILGLFPTIRVTIRDPRVRKELLERVNSTLRKPINRIDPADAALVAIVAAGDLTLVLDRKTRRAYKRRIKELIDVSAPIAPALRKSVQAAAAAAAGG